MTLVHSQQEPRPDSDVREVIDRCIPLPARDPRVEVIGVDAASDALDAVRGPEERDLSDEGLRDVAAALYCTVAGIPVTKLLSQERIDAIVERTKGAGCEVVALLMGRESGQQEAPN